MTSDTAKRFTREQTYRRSIGMEARAIDADARTVELSFSSDAPVERWGGYEVLEHRAGAVRLDRMNEGAALLVGHDHHDQVGVVERAFSPAAAAGRWCASGAVSVRQRCSRTWWTAFGAS